MALNYSGKFSVSPDVISQEYMGETMLMNTKTLVYIRLDQLAGSLWQLLEKNDDVDAVFRELKQEKGIPDQQLEGLMNACLGNFQKLHWVTLSGDV